MTRLHLICGVGGVGKTTLAAAMGVGYALAGQDVVVVTIDPAKRLADALGVSVGPTPTRVALEAPGTLHALMVDQKHAFDRAIRDLHPDAALVERLAENRYYRAVSERLAGAPEYMALETLYRLHDEGRWDVIVVDTPPAGDALDVFRAPRRLERVFGRTVLWTLLSPRSRLLKALTRPGAATLRRLMGASVVDDIGDFFKLIAGMADGFADHARAVSDLLASDIATTLLVVDAENPDRADASGFLDALRREGPHFAGIVVNRVHQDPGVTDQPLAVPTPAGVPADAWTQALTGLRQAALEERGQATRHASVVSRMRRTTGVAWSVPALDDGSSGSLEGLAVLAASLPPMVPDG